MKVESCNKIFWPPFCIFFKIDGVVYYPFDINVRGRLNFSLSTRTTKLIQLDYLNWLMNDKNKLRPQKCLFRIVGVVYYPFDQCMQNSQICSDEESRYAWYSVVTIVSLSKVFRECHFVPQTTKISINTCFSIVRGSILPLWH